MKQQFLKNSNEDLNFERQYFICKNKDRFGLILFCFVSF